jgi:hypothetical protein
VRQHHRRKNNLIISGADESVSQAAEVSTACRSICSSTVNDQRRRDRFMTGTKSLHRTMAKR